MALQCSRLWELSLNERRRALEASGLCMYCLRHPAKLECYGRGGPTKPGCPQPECGGKHAAGAHELLGKMDASINFIAGDYGPDEDEEAVRGAAAPRGAAHGGAAPGEAVRSAAAPEGAAHADLLQGRQYEVQLLQEEQPMTEWTQGKRQRTKLPPEEQHTRRLPQRKQCEVQLLQREQPMAEWTQGEQQRTKLL